MLIKLLEGMKEKEPGVTGTIGFKKTPASKSRRPCHQPSWGNNHSCLMTLTRQARFQLLLLPPSIHNSEPSFSAGVSERRPWPLFCFLGLMYLFTGSYFTLRTSAARESRKTRLLLSSLFQHKTEHKKMWEWMFRANWPHQTPVLYTNFRTTSAVTHLST